MIGLIWKPGARNNHFTRTVAAALARMGLTSVWQGQDVDHTHAHTDGISTSVIDHFMVSRLLLELVEDCGPVHRSGSVRSASGIRRHSPAPAPPYACLGQSHP